MRKIFLFVLAAVLLGEASAAAAAEFPLKKSANLQDRFLVDQQGIPFFINGDTPWSLVGQVSKEDAQIYIADAADKGINALIITIPEGYYATNAPANYYQVQPFTTPNKFSTPNTVYFDHADWVIRKAAEYGILVIVAPNYLGCCSDGWLSALQNNNTATDARIYGEFIGNRYKDFPNIMYVWGNDLNPPGTTKTKIKAMVDGVKSKDPNHLHTYHWAPENSAVEQWSSEWDAVLDVNITYTYDAVQNKILEDYNRTPAHPFFLFESKYENDWGSCCQQQRLQAYNAVLSGAGGHFYGNDPIWHMSFKNGGGDGWKSHLNDEARADLLHIRALFESRPWHLLVPDQNHIVVTGGVGTGDGYVGAAQTTDGNTLIAYIPLQKQITVNMTKITGSGVRGWWFNPRDGSATLIGTYSNIGSQSFTPTSNTDWVLVLDNADLNLPAPGTTVTQPSVTPTPQVTNTPTPVPVTGDANGDGHVDGIDYVIWLNNYGQSSTTGPAAGDFDNSGNVDGVDYVLWLNNYGL